MKLLNCTEDQLHAQLQKWIASNRDLLKNAILFLEGEMGAGKSTLARILLTELVSDFSSQGSPTFPLVQEYRSKAGHPIYHIDLYRLKNEGELEDSGILHQIEEIGSLAMVEWPDLFPAAFSYWQDPSKKRAKKVVLISIRNRGPVQRDYFIKIV